jgi:hypothetical protein
MPGIEAYGRADWPIIAVQKFGFFVFSHARVRPLT